MRPTADFFGRMLRDRCGTDESWRHSPESRLALAVIASAFHDLAHGEPPERDQAAGFIRGPGLDFWAKMAALNAEQVRHRLDRWRPVIESFSPPAISAGDTQPHEVAQ